MLEREGQNYVKVPSEDWVKLQQKIQILISENDVLVDESKTRAKGIEQLSTIIEQQAEEISSLRETESNLESQIESLTQQLESSQQNLQNQESHCNNLHEQLSAANQASEQLESQLVESRESVAAEKTRFEGIKAALDQITEKYHELMEEAEVAAERERELIGAVRMLEVENEEVAAELRDSKTETEALKTQVQHL
ncbi:hypothetical protein HDU99_007500, partial [Rhizoclosmatium hyalinum]